MYVDFINLEKVYVDFINLEKVYGSVGVCNAGTRRQGSLDWSWRKSLQQNEQVLRMYDVSDKQLISIKSMCVNN